MRHSLNKTFYCLILALLTTSALGTGRLLASEPQALPSIAFAYQGVDTQACQNPANPVVTENCQPGTSDWITQKDLGDIEIYASKDTLNVGESVDFFVNTSAPTFDLTVYRNGYYGGLGGRLVHTHQGVAGKAQAACARAEDTGLRTCSRWEPSYTLPIPNDWVSGVYIAVVQRPDTGGQAQTVFVVRQDDRKSTILYQQSVTTFQAYNNYGGKSVYSSNSGTCTTLSEAPRAVKVSLNRPYNQSKNDPNYYFRVEYPMVRWLEQQGYDVTYSTSMDTHRSGKAGATNRLLDHKVFLSVGHDEYWSQEMRDAITAARDAGVNIGFFTANTSYWRVRFEPDPLTNEPDSVMVVYKTTESGPPDANGPTGTWRDPQGANNPENSLPGVMYIGDNDTFYFPLRVSADQAQDAIYRHTGLQNMPPNTYIDVGQELVGWEWDATVDNGHTPADLTVLAASPVYGLLLQDAGNFANGNLGQAAAQTVRYTAPSGAKVFASGTIQWSWGLGAQGLDVVDPNPIISQMTYNILADMGAAPATPSANVIVDGSNAPDPVIPADQFKPAGGSTPQITDVQATVNGQSVTITWTTDVESIGQVWFGKESGHIIYNLDPDTEYGTNHSFTMDELDPHQTYWFKVASVDRNWGVSISDESQFQAAGLSFTGEIGNALSPLTTRAGCWLRGNATTFIFVVVLAVVVVGLVIWRGIIYRRQPAQTKTG